MYLAVIMYLAVPLAVAITGSTPSPQICSPPQLLGSYSFSFRRSGRDSEQCKSGANRLEGCPGPDQSHYDMEGVYSTSLNVTFGDCDPQTNDTEPSCESGLKGVHTEPSCEL